MIATAEQYLQDLWLLYSENMPTKAILLPNDEIIYEIDLNTRVAKTPSFLSVRKDQAAETIYFLADRFFGEVDLATTACVIEYRNNEGTESYYPVPFYDISTYSSHVTDDYLEISVNSGTYKPNTYYVIKDGEYVLSTEGYDEEEIYYTINDLSSNRKYVVASVDASNYAAGKYYYFNGETHEYVLDLSDTFNANKSYFISLDKRYIKANVEYSNYKVNTYYMLDKNNEMELATGAYNPNIEYYSLIDKPKILFPWCITNDATAAAGVLQFSIRFYQVDSETGRLVYNMSTIPAQSKILETMSVEISDDKFEDIKDTPSGYYYDALGREATVLEDLYFKIAAKNDIYWDEA